MSTDLSQAGVVLYRLARHARWLTLARLGLSSIRQCLIRDSFLDPWTHDLGSSPAQVCWILCQQTACLETAADELFLFEEEISGMTVTAQANNLPTTDSERERCEK